MEREKIENIVRQAIANVTGVTYDDVLPEKDLHQDLGADSLDLMEAVMIIEEDIPAEITDEEFEGAPRTVQGLIDLALRAAEREERRAK